MLFLSLFLLGQVKCEDDTCFPASDEWRAGTFVVLGFGVLNVGFCLSEVLTYKKYVAPPGIFVFICLIRGFIYSYVPCWISLGWTVYMMGMLGLFGFLETLAFILWIEESDWWPLVSVSPFWIFAMTSICFVSLFFGIVTTLIFIESGLILCLLRGEDCEKPSAVFQTLLLEFADEMTNVFVWIQLFGHLLIWQRIIFGVFIFLGPAVVFVKTLLEQCIHVVWTDGERPPTVCEVFLSPLLKAFSAALCYELKLCVFSNLHSIFDVNDRKNANDASEIREEYYLLSV